MPNVICQKWEESERGWGTRPDGYSLHLTEADRKAYIKVYWDSMPDTAPSEYSRPSGTAYAMEIDDETFAKVEGARAEHGLMLPGQPPGNEGPDGWRTAK